MKVKFCGADRVVTGSSHLLQLENGKKLLLDCGLYQGNDEDMEKYNLNWFFDPKEIDYVVLSHAHIDHSGKLPLLYKHGYRGPIYCTHATRSLSAIMLLDSAKIHEYDAAYESKKTKKEVKPLYETEHAIGVMDLFVAYNYDTWFRIDDDIQVYFTDAGHILGSAAVALHIKEGDELIRFGFTGDIGRPERPILRDPKPLPPMDYLICESTYGDKDHMAKPDEYDKFLNILKHTCVEKKGKLIIPAFSVGRTQELIYMMDRLYHNGLLPKIPVYVDSPLAVNATVIYGSHPECYDSDINEYMLTDEDPFGFNSLHYVTKADDSKALNQRKDPCVIISASGMATAGRIRHHIFHNIEDGKNTILMVGYAAPYTLAGQLLAGQKEVRIFGETLQVNAEINRISSLSAHGDRHEMLNFIKNQKNTLKRLYLVHGESDTIDEWERFLGNKGFNNIFVPNIKYEDEIS